MLSSDTGASIGLLPPKTGSLPSPQSSSASALSLAAATPAVAPITAVLLLSLPPAAAVAAAAAAACCLGLAGAVAALLTGEGGLTLAKVPLLNVTPLRASQPSLCGDVGALTVVLPGALPGARPGALLNCLSLNTLLLFAAVAAAGVLRLLSLRSGRGDQASAHGLRLL
eukprot:3076-Heterococcus_DN1.PRE.2